ncbi:hypothetical protein AWU65_24155 [Paenibacillus glucanolyticus]|uniref:Uncharacterized protein n=1 Tax=Paenibacillus glucanolyticus TaxID=59843 RepID=A0A163M7C2_9BACL|nr:hypothetical protein [Paenibacillus glucanolyticus]KZS48808.1 hypothetical protein AWU65_24155 [Paenibacillus glucanolyticus]OMF66240.1 hypothetical protein BK142_29535 [Paenibacillus glucanolyticus]
MSFKKSTVGLLVLALMSVTSITAFAANEVTKKLYPAARPPGITSDIEGAQQDRSVDEDGPTSVEAVPPLPPIEDGPVSVQAVPPLPPIQ